MKATLKLTTMGLVVFGLSACTKNPEQKRTEARQEAEKEISETRREATEDINEAKKEEAEKLREANKEDAQKSGDVGAAGTRTDNKEAFQKSIEDRVDKLDEAIDDIEGQVKDKPETARTVLAPVVVDAKAKVEAAKVQLKGLSDTTESNWTTMRSEVLQSVTTAEAAVDTARKQLAAH